jgi:hypothetical protein
MTSGTPRLKGVVRSAFAKYRLLSLGASLRPRFFSRAAQNGALGHFLILSSSVGAEELPG